MVVAEPAEAIQQDVCNWTNVQVISHATTCWAWAGTKNVTLPNVSWVMAGINAGHVRTTFGRYTYFSPGQTNQVWPQYFWQNNPTVNQVAIR
jgi:tRNA/tmRNA/rRNA uracil-C5-methylase (TrmA/RlmC/RlmD family)